MFFGLLKGALRQNKCKLHSFPKVEGEGKEHDKARSPSKKHDNPIKNIHKSIKSISKGKTSTKSILKPLFKRQEFSEVPIATAQCDVSIPLLPLMNINSTFSVENFLDELEHNYSPQRSHSAESFAGASKSPTSSLGSSTHPSKPFPAAPGASIDLGSLEEPSISSEDPHRSFSLKDSFARTLSTGKLPFVTPKTMKEYKARIKYDSTSLTRSPKEKELMINTGDPETQTIGKCRPAYKNVQESPIDQNTEDISTLTNELVGTSEKESGDALGGKVRHPRNEEQTEGNSGADYTIRQDWNTIKAIPAWKFRVALHVNYSASLWLTPNDIRVVGYRQGSYHYVVILRLKMTDSTEDFVIKIPAHGTAALWTKEDAEVLRSEAELMKHIHDKTTIPVPKVLAYSENTDNEIGHPYIIMSRLPGKPAHDIWLGGLDGLDGNNIWSIADCPSEYVKTRRITFLRSLASYMAQLNKLEFDAIGMPVFDRYKQIPLHIGPSYHWNSPTDANKVAKRGPFASTEQYITHSLDEIKNDFLSDFDSESSESSSLTATHRHLGLTKIFDIIYSSAIFKSEEKETFVIHHNDLDFQNIFTDEEGHVTGILDWERSFVAPRFVGYAAVPKFLRRDWFPDFTLERVPCMAWMTESYRQIYAEAMQETGAPDAKYTSKSALYQAAIGALYEGGGIIDFVSKVLEHVNGLRLTNQDEFVVRLGIGWPAAEEHLRREIPKLFWPQLPDSRLPPTLAAFLFPNSP